MDHVDLAEIFNSPTVIMVGFEDSKAEIDAACRIIFGRALEPTELAELIAAPDRSELSVSSMKDDDSIQLRLAYKWFGETHDYLIYIDTETDRRVIEFENIHVLVDAPYLLETHLLAYQVRSFRRFKIDEIRLYADGYAGDPSGMVGYYVWARLGFMMFLDGFGPQLAAAGFDPRDTTLDLFAQDGGDKWWYNHGSARAAVFYLQESSPCSIALQGYLDEKGVL